MKILSAKHYPNIQRTVVRVVENPDDPKWVHPDGTPAPEGHTGNTSEEGTICEDCRSNWRIQEHLWTGEELQFINERGVRQDKSHHQILDELRQRLHINELRSQDLSDMVGRDL